MKKIMSILLAIVIILTMMPCTVLAEDNVLDYLTYEINDGEVTITGYNDSIVSDVVIPDTIEGYPVTAIGDQAFYLCEQIKNIKIGGNVKIIGKAAFWCPIETVTLSEGLECIDESAFWGCNIQNITIPDSVTTIGNCAFQGCIYLEYIVMGKGVTTIGYEAFLHCNLLNDVYYTGTEEQWNSIDIGSANSSLKNALIHFDFSKEEDSEDKFNVPADAAEFNGNSYYVFTDKMDWTDAKEFCEEQGGHLVTITSESEQKFVATLIESFDDASDFYIGISDIEEEGNWSTWVTGEAVTYTNWGDNEPDDNYGGQDSGVITNGTRGSENGDYYCTNFQWDDQQSSKYFMFICEWEATGTSSDIIELGEHFPEGYDFLEDSYQFANYIDDIGIKYFTTLYDQAPGTLLYENEDNIHGETGVCFGMSYTTASIFNGFPASDSWYKKDFILNDYVCNMRDIGKSNDYKSKIGDLEISIIDYIRYAHIYQCSSEVSDSLDLNLNDINNLKNAVNNYLAEDRIGVVIVLFLYNLDENGNRIINNKGEYEFAEGHALLAVGVDGDDILIDDPNNEKDYERLTINADNSWTYSNSPWTKTTDSNNCAISYCLDFYRPYQILKSGEFATVSSEYIDSSEETYVNGMERLDNNNLLLAVDCSSFSLDSSDYVSIKTIGSVENNSDTCSKKMYWVKNTNKVDISNLNEENNTITIAREDSIVKASVKKNSDLSMSINNGENSVIINTKDENETIIAFTQVDDSGNKINIEMSGLATGDLVTATENASCIEITGLNDITVTYETEDDTLVTTVDVDDGATVTISVDESENTIIADVDNSGNNNDDNENKTIDDYKNDFKDFRFNSSNDAFENVWLNATVKEFREYYDLTDEDSIFFSSDGEVLNGDDIIYTGCKHWSISYDRNSVTEFNMFVYGDINGDGKITASDARLVLRTSAQIEVLDDVYSMAADVNGDNKITAADARKILRVSAKLETM